MLRPVKSDVISIDVNMAGSAARRNPNHGWGNPRCDGRCPRELCSRPCRVQRIWLTRGQARASGHPAHLDINRPSPKPLPSSRPTYLRTKEVVVCPWSDQSRPVGENRLVLISAIGGSIEAVLGPIVEENLIGKVMTTMLERWPVAASQHQEWAAAALVRPAVYGPPRTHAWIVPVEHVDDFDRRPEMYEHLSNLSDLKLDDQASPRLALDFWSSAGRAEIEPWSDCRQDRPAHPVA
jgi:hypothetical protein